MIEINFPQDYPFKPPNLRFKTKIYHPNVSPNSVVFAWTSCRRNGARLLLTDANPDDPLVPEAANLYKKN